MLVTIVSFVLVLGVLVFFHELGHCTGRAVVGRRGGVDHGCARADKAVDRVVTHRERAINGFVLYLWLDVLARQSTLSWKVYFIT